MNRSWWGARRAVPVVGVAAVAAIVAAGCGSSGSSGGSGSGAGSGTTPSTSQQPQAKKSAAPGMAYQLVNVAGMGKVLADASGRTVYLLTNDGKHNVSCTDASGCTKVWPDLPLPDGVQAASAGPGVNTSLLKAKKLADGETYATYNGWLLYEYVGDHARGDANGQGIRSFGGTWYAVTAAGAPAKASSASSNSNSGGGYSY